MLPLGILLLLGSLAVADAGCNKKDIITGDMLIGAENDTLVCEKANEEIEYASQRFEQLDCADGEWTHKGEPLKPPLGVYATLYYKCVAKDSTVAPTEAPASPYHCRPNFIGGSWSRRVNNTFTCIDSGKVFEHGQYQYAYLTCADMEWKYDGKSLIPPVSDQTFYFECVDKRPDTVTTDAPTTRASDTNTPESAPIETTTLAPITSTTRQVARKCDPSLIRGAAPEEIHFDEATKQFTCVDKGANSLTLMEFDESPLSWYEAIECHENGELWAKKYAGRIYGKDIIANASSEVTVKCVKYCASTGEGTKVEKIEDNLYGRKITVTCADPSLELFHGGRPIGGSASCFPGGKGWTVKDGAIDGDSKTSIIIFECKQVTPTTPEPVPEKTTTLAPITSTIKAVARKCDPSLIQGVAPEEFTYDANNNKLTCNDGKAIEYRYRRYPELVCKRKGWEGTEIGGTYPLWWTAVPLEIRCVTVTPVTRAPATTTLAPITEASRKCDPSLIRGAAPEEFTYDANNNKLTCNDGKVIEHQYRLFPQLVCVKKGWEGTEYGSAHRLLLTTIPLEIQCVTVAPTTRAPVTTTPSPGPVPTTKQTPVTTKANKPVSRDSITTMIEQNPIFFCLLVLAIAVLFCYMSGWTGDEAKSKRNPEMTYPNMNDV